MRRFFIDKPASIGMPHTIQGPDAKHIASVLRMKQGDTIGMFDGKGHTLMARINAISPKAVQVTITDMLAFDTDSPVHITLGQALLKDKKMDGLVRQLTELGISEWLPFETERAVPDRNRMHVSQRIARWESIARESLKQCERGMLPRIHPPVSFDEVVDAAAAYDMGIIFTGNDTPALEKTAQPVSRILILIGPEGGFTAGEIDHARAKGLIPAGMGPRILKADTAAVAACALVQHIFGDM
ncbi:MAG: 16S rRNA (uracil(1498)-N(3))-methyltransferase [Thermodesulfobacteriota bacterium]|nr:16S rRNA (uracil(1498)-N(3))-methyltransferase [Thermodesulfobacteriota bacterium]